jgi:tetratricopeptide (TPR) repeat protein
MSDRGIYWRRGLDRASFMLVLALCLAVPVKAQLVKDPFIQGKVFFSQGKYSQALAELGQVTGETLAEPEYCLIKGRCLLGLSMPSKAIQLFHRADSLQEGTASFDMARAYASQGMDSMAVAYLRRHLTSPDRLPEQVVKLDPAFRQIERKRSWINLWKTEFYTEQEKVVQEALYLLTAGKLEESLALVNDEISRDKPSSGLLLVRSRIYQAYSNDRKALSDLNQALSLDPGNKIILVEQATVYKHLDQPDNEIRDLGSAILLDPTDISLRKRRADAYLQREDPDKAWNDIEIYLLYYPEEGEGIRLAGNICSRMQDNVKALELFSRNIQLHPGVADYYIDRATIYMLTRMYGYAINDYAMSLDLKPGNPLVYLRRAQARMETGDMDGACYDWNKARSYGAAEAQEFIDKYCLPAKKWP